LLAELRDNNELFANFLEQATLNPQCRGQNLDSFLIMVPHFFLLVVEMRVVFVVVGGAVAAGERTD
jgi:hypothetical protein